MAIELVTKNTPDYLNSGYLFSKNPLFWEFQRADLVAFNVLYWGGGDSATFRILEKKDNNIEGDYINTLLNVGSIIYVKGNIYNSEGIVADKRVTITSISGVLYNLIEIDTNIEYKGNDANCIVNLTAFDTWNVQLKLTIYKDEQIELTNKIVSFTDGTFAINVQDFINKYINYRNNWQYNLINWNDKDMSVNAKIEALINYRGDDNIKTQVIDTKTFIYGANQSVNQYKSSAYLYKMIEGKFAKFLTKFPVLRAWSGYPADASIVFGEGSISNLSRLYNNGTSITEQAFYKYGSDNNRDIVHRVLISDLTASGTVACGYANPNTGDIYVDDEYVDCDYVDPCDDSYIYRTETKRFIYDNSCKDYPIYLKWRNELGGVDYWLFNCRYAEAYKMFDSELREVLEMDLSLDGGRLQLLNKKCTKSLTIQEYVTEANKEGFISLLKSKHIQLYMGLINGEHRWLDVALSENTLKFNVHNKQYDMKFTLNLGEQYI